MLRTGERILITTLYIHNMTVVSTTHTHKKETRRVLNARTKSTLISCPFACHQWCRSRCKYDSVCYMHLPHPTSFLWQKNCGCHSKYAAIRRGELSCSSRKQAGYDEPCLDYAPTMFFSGNTELRVDLGADGVTAALDSHSYNGHDMRVGI